MVPWDSTRLVDCQGCICAGLLWEGQGGRLLGCPVTELGVGHLQAFSNLQHRRGEGVWVGGSHSCREGAIGTLCGWEGPRALWRGMWGVQEEGCEVEWGVVMLGRGRLRNGSGLLAERSKWEEGVGSLSWCQSRGWASCKQEPGLSHTVGSPCRGQWGGQPLAGRRLT